MTLIESIDPLGPFGAKEASEGGLHSVPPAVAAAVCDAIGVRMHELPITPDRLLAVIHERRRERQRQAARAAKV